MKYFSIIIISVLFNGCSKETPTGLSLVWRTNLSNATDTVLEIWGTNPIIYQDLAIFTLRKPREYKKPTLIALNKNTGAKIWQWQKNYNEIGSFSGNRAYYIYNNLGIFALSSTLGFGPYRFIAINLNNGSLVWEKYFSNNGSVRPWEGLIGVEDKVYYQSYEFVDGETYSSITIREFNIITQEDKIVIQTNNAEKIKDFSGFSIYQANDNNQMFLAAMVENLSSDDYVNAKLKNYELFKYNIRTGQIVYKKTLNYPETFIGTKLVGYYNGNFILNSKNCYKLVGEADGSDHGNYLKWLPTSLTYPIAIDRRANCYNDPGGVIDFIIFKNYLISPYVKVDLDNNKVLFDPNTVGYDANLSYYPFYKNENIYKNVNYWSSFNTGILYGQNINTGQYVTYLKSPDDVSLNGHFIDKINLDQTTGRIYVCSYLDAYCYQVN